MGGSLKGWEAGGEPHLGWRAGCVQLEPRVARGTWKSRGEAKDSRNTNWFLEGQATQTAGAGTSARLQGRPRYRGSHWEPERVQ